uniref:Uncharacterized protein n=1 Tax=Cannabis sativa TaxID=3483 RepID=A0A803R9P4_CANSA
MTLFAVSFGTQQQSPSVKDHTKSVQHPCSSLSLCYFYFIRNFCYFYFIRKKKADLIIFYFFIFVSDFLYNELLNEYLICSVIFYN